MAQLTIPYERTLTDADLAEVIARATATINVMQQLGAAYQSLPGYAMAGYETETNATEADLTALQALADSAAVLMTSLDTKGAPLKIKNEGALAALRGLLKGKAEEALLDQITGPHAQAGGGTPPTTPT